MPETQLKRDGLPGIDDSLLIHYGQEFEQIAHLFDHVTGSYVWAHDLATLHYSDHQTDYPALFELWKPVELGKTEEGRCAAQVNIKESKAAFKDAEPRKWRAYLLGVWQRPQKKHPDLKKLYDTRLTIVKRLVQNWQAAHPDLDLPLTFDSWFTQPEFCQFLNKTLHMACVGTLSETDKVNLKTGQISPGEFAKKLKEEHLAAIKTGGKPIFQKNTVTPLQKGHFTQSAQRTQRFFVDFALCALRALCIKWFLQ